MGHRIFTTAVADVYPHYVTKAERKGRTRAEVDELPAEHRPQILEKPFSTLDVRSILATVNEQIATKRA